MAKDEDAASRSTWSEIEPDPSFEAGDRPTLPLGKRELTIDMDGTTSTVEAELALSFAPSPRIVAQFEEPLVEGWFGIKFFDDKYKVYLADNPNALARPLKFTGKYAQVYWERPKLAGSSCKGIWYVTFYIVNFTWLPWKKLVLEDERWRITIDEHEPEVVDHKDLGSNRAYRLTHVGRLEKKNGKTFKSAQAQAVQKRLAQFLCFAKGDWCPPLAFRGFNYEGEEIWYDWSFDHHSRSRTLITWWNPVLSTNTLPQFFEKFMALTESNKVWEAALTPILYWYAHSNTRAGGVDGAIVLLQAALEKLAWTYLHQDLEALDEGAFDKLTADDRIRLMLRFCDISCTIDDHFPRLQRFAAGHKNQKQFDGPKAIAEIRNSVVHPDTKDVQARAKYSDGVPYEQALQLGLEYFELFILRLCKYKGPYRRHVNSNLRHGTLEIT